MKTKTVIITGASSGIGEACAHAFSQSGYRVSLGARRLDRLQKIQKDILERGGECHIQALDVTQPESIQNLIQSTLNQWGSLDCFINNAGVGCVGNIATVPMENARKVFDVNVFGALQCIQAIVPIMKKQNFGTIVNVSSVLGKRAVPEIGTYCATKHALNALSDALRIEVKEDGIHVLTVGPGYTETEFSDSQIRKENEDPVRTSLKGQTARQVAQSIFKATEKRKRDIYLTLHGKFLISLERICPHAIDWAMGFRKHLMK